MGLDRLLLEHKNAIGWFAMRDQSCGELGSTGSCRYGVRIRRVHTGEHGMFPNIKHKMLAGIARGNFVHAFHGGGKPLH